MTSTSTPAIAVWREELRKFPAFFRRDLLINLSYRAAFISDWAGVLIQIGLFYLLSRLVDPTKVPRFGGSDTTYLAFASVGLAFSGFVHKSLNRIVMTTRSEQLMGTLESLLATPSAAGTLQLGSIAYDLVYLPLRTGLFLGLMTLVFGLDFHVGGLGPFVVILVVFLPFMWGLGLISASTVLMVRRGSGMTMAMMTLMTMASPTFLPLAVLPGWLQGLAGVNPLTVALDGARDALLGNAGWSTVVAPVAVLVPGAVLTLALGGLAFRFALRRERRRGTLYLY